MSNVLRVCFILISISLCESGRIIGVFPTPSISHHIIYRSLMEAMAERGHHLVILTPDPVNYTDPKYSNITEIDLHDISYSVWTSTFNFAELRENTADIHATFPIFFEAVLKISEKQLLSEKVQKLLNDPREHFDLCIVECFLPTNYMFKARFDCKLILISSLSGDYGSYEVLGNPLNPALYPNVYMTPFDVSNFWHRLYAAYENLYIRWLEYNHVHKPFEKLAHRVFNLTTSLREMHKKADLLFITMNPLLESIKPHLSNIVFISGIHIKQPKTLPDKLQTFLDEATQGAIYFSFGSNVKATHLKYERRKAFLDAFRELPYKILWKWEDETLPDKPSNVYISKWMPQQDILAHPNIKLFITQGGYQSLEESVHFGVPVIAIPFFSDQYFNADKIVKLNIGKTLNFVSITKDVLIESIQEIVSNSSYYDNVKKLRNIIYDKPLTNLEHAIWWMEYLLRHRDTSHLRSPVGDLNIFQQFLLDIFLFVFIILLLVIAVIFILIKYSIFYIITRNKGKEKTS